MIFCYLKFKIILWLHTDYLRSWMSWQVGRKVIKKIIILPVYWFSILKHISASNKAKLAKYIIILQFFQTLTMHMMKCNNPECLVIPIYVFINWNYEVPILLSFHDFHASLVSSVGRVVALLTGWYWVRIPVGLALHLISPHPRVCK